MKNPFKKLAALCVTAYANLLFKTAMKKADRLYRENHQMYYVASQVFRPNVLTIYDRKKFKIEKVVLGFAARITTLQTLKNGCYYHTPDKAGNQAMTAHDIEVRRRYFVRERLSLAKLR